MMQQASASQVWQVYPRPQLRRDNYVNLNGWWDFALCDTDQPPVKYDRQIQVPFCPESQLSGVNEPVSPGKYLFYRRYFPRPQGNGRVLLHVGAADQIATIYVNQTELAVHEGGYHSFTVDITDALLPQNELVIRCLDDLRSPRLPYGKQSLNRGGMWYTPVSGIWQTIWLETVPQNHIRSLSLAVNLECAQVTVTPALEGVVLFRGKSIPLVNGTATLTPETPRHWTPEDPYLYDFSVETQEDRVESYFALRTIESKIIDGIPRLCLNGRPYFFHGLLDQGYWPEGIYTPPSPESYAQDITAAKALGFNTLRKHIKIEPEEFYYQCDKLGMIVFQDMVNNGPYHFLRDTVIPTFVTKKRLDHGLHRDPDSRRAFLKSMEQTVAQLQNHPCILYWTIFNEGWGQFEADKAYEQLRQLDNSRIIDATSGWFWQTRSDVSSHHIYFGGWRKLKVTDKPLVLSEFGGFACPIPDHQFKKGNSYGYRFCSTASDFQNRLYALYQQRILPAIPKGLCGTILTQLSDVEDEINGLYTYDRQVCKGDRQVMVPLSESLQEAVISGN
jgi:hypothetical protein